MTWTFSQWHAHIDSSTSCAQYSIAQYNKKKKKRNNWQDGFINRSYQENVWMDFDSYKLVTAASLQLQTTIIINAIGQKMTQTNISVSLLCVCVCGRSAYCYFWNAFVRIWWEAHNFG